MQSFIRRCSRQQNVLTEGDAKMSQQIDKLKQEQARLRGGLEALQEKRNELTRFVRCLLDNATCAELCCGV